MISPLSDTECDADRTTLREVGPSAPSVTIIVPVRNEERHIAHTLDQLLAQERQGIHTEILVVDGRSTDNTREIVAQYAEKHPIIRLLDNPQQLSSAARNEAIRQSHGEYLVLIDGHCEIPGRTYFHDIVDTFRRTGADCLGRPQPLDVTDATPLQRAIAAARDSWLGHHPESFIYSDQPQFVPAKSVAVAYRRDVFEKVGFFDEQFDAHEDGEFNYRCDAAGLRCYFTPSIAVAYFPRSRLGDLYRQMARYGRGRVRFSRKHAGTWGIDSLLPAILVAGTVLGPLVCLILPICWPLYFAVLMVYGMAILGESLRRALQNRDVSILPWLPAVFSVIHLGSGTGVLTEALTGRRLTAKNRNPNVHASF